ncbi:MAG: sn-glycerol-3-phosphate ABC transporter ATP-binding protein UgpC [Myxococcales bacterium]|nr:sn-glycerol-3-phosphate ABC transporter ATP-binding protein UgpC [Myxococcales bacterium]HRC58405.1 sn-glycerol-3-phosphate ABC transporter ATP-binding protein UgpC [Kofleriaceae bacterium]
MADVVLRDIRKSFGDVEIIHGASLEIKDGEFVVFVGPSGCGKSTLLRLIAGLEEVSAGKLSIGGRECNTLPPAERGIAMVFQSYALYPHMSVFDNMAFALKLAHMDKTEITSRVHKAADILQLRDYLHRKPKELSGGQRQRVAIGRAIVREPSVFLFDEPLSNLDAALRVQMRIEISKLHSQLKTTVIYVTHDQVEAMTMADRIVVLSQGNVEQFGAPLELYSHPRNLFVAGFIGSPKMNFFSGEVQEASATGATVTLRDGSKITLKVDATRAKKGDKVTVGARPEHLDARPVEGGSSIPGDVTLVEHLGEQTLLYVTCPASTELVTVRASGISKVKKGDTVKLSAANGAFYLFDDEGKSFTRLEPEIST